MRRCLHRALRLRHLPLLACKRLRFLFVLRCLHATLRMMRMRLASRLAHDTHRRFWILAFL